MRMWKVNPKYLCDHHLLGEHVEMHMFAGCIKKDKSIKDYLTKGLVEVHNITSRHKELVKEMKKRGFNHQSSLMLKGYPAGKVDVNANLKELARRCINCRKRITVQGILKARLHK